MTESLISLGGVRLNARVTAYPNIIGCSYAPEASLSAHNYHVVQACDAVPLDDRFLVRPKVADLLRHASRECGVPVSTVYFAYRAVTAALEGTPDIFRLCVVGGAEEFNTVLRSGECVARELTDIESEKAQDRQVRLPPLCGHAFLTKDTCDADFGIRLIDTCCGGGHVTVTPAFPSTFSWRGKSPRRTPSGKFDLYLDMDTGLAVTSNTMSGEMIREAMSRFPADGVRAICHANKVGTYPVTALMGAMFTYSYTDEDVRVEIYGRPSRYAKVSLMSAVLWNTLRHFVEQNAVND